LDRLGWRDPFSSAEWSQRQVRYANTMRLSSAYTPQAVVGGTREFVGSNHAALDVALEGASNSKPRGDVALTARRERDTVVVTVHATVPAEADLMLALTQDGLITKIEHGENAGRTETNDAIVRRLGPRRSGAADDHVQNRPGLAQSQCRGIRSGSENPGHRRRRGSAGSTVESHPRKMTR